MHLGGRLNQLIIMAGASKLLPVMAFMYPLLAQAGSIADIDHVVLFMQGTKSGSDAYCS